MQFYALNSRLTLANTILYIIYFIMMSVTYYILSNNLKVK